MMHGLNVLAIPCDWRRGKDSFMACWTSGNSKLDLSLSLGLMKGISLPSADVFVDDWLVLRALEVFWDVETGFFFTWCLESELAKRNPFLNPPKEALESALLFVSDFESTTSFFDCMLTKPALLVSEGFVHELCFSLCSLNAFIFSNSSDISSSSGTSAITVSAWICCKVYFSAKS